MIERRKQTPIQGEILFEEKALHDVQQSSGSKSRNVPATSNNKNNNTCKARSLLFAVASIYSTNCASLKFLETVCNGDECQELDDSPAATTFTRFLLTATICIPILLFHPPYRSLYFAGIECGCLMMVNYVCQAVSLEYIPAAKCTFIGALAVITTPLYAKFCRKNTTHSISRSHWISVGLSIFGVGILENVIPIPYVVPTNTAHGIGMGDILALGQPLAFGYAMLRIEEQLERHKHIPQRVLLLTSVQCITVCILSGLWVYGSGATISLSSYIHSPQRMIGLVWLGIVTTVVAIVLQGKAFQAGATSTEAALFYSSEPVFGAIFARWLLGERPNMGTYVGGGCILMACLLGSLPSQKTTSIKRPLVKSKQSGIWLEGEDLSEVSTTKVDKV